MNDYEEPETWLKKERTSDHVTLLKMLLIGSLGLVAYSCADEDDANQPPIWVKHPSELVIVDFEDYMDMRDYWRCKYCGIYNKYRDQTYRCLKCGNTDAMGDGYVMSDQ